MECPICYDVITENTNTVITECGHKFHTNCLMTNIAHNGFGCPCCRTTMAEVPEDEDEYEEDDFESVNEDNISDYALRGMRWLYQRANGEELDDEEDEEEEEEEEEEMTPKPSVELITRKLKNQGVTMEDLIKTLLLVHEEYEREEDEYEAVEAEIFGKIRIIISNYNEAEEIVATSKPTPTIARAPVQVDKF